MEKQQIIAFINEQIANGKITPSDLATITSTNSSVVVKEQSSPANLINIFYTIGTIIAIVGVGILVAQHWDEIGFAGRVIVTLGISLATYIFGWVFGKPEQKSLSQIMFVFSAALAPLGSYVLLHEAGVTYDQTIQIMVATVLFIIFGTALFFSKRNILVLVTIGFGSWAYYAIVLKMFGSNGYYLDGDFIKWASMLLGAAYLFIAYGYSSSVPATDESDAREKRAIQNVLYGLGTLAILGAGIFVGGIFDLVYIALIFAAIYGSVYVKSRSMLMLGSLFLMAHIIKITSKYFIDSIGWPVALIGVGFLVIGVGYMTYYLNRKFISS
ncbi:MAG: DUF2157 domain-containing protein [bacterium]